MVPLNIVRGDEDVLEFHILACPYEAYKGLFDVICCGKDTCHVTVRRARE
jgi:hypothetical protein